MDKNEAFERLVQDMEEQANMDGVRHDPLENPLRRAVRQALAMEGVFSQNN